MCYSVLAVELQKLPSSDSCTYREALLPLLSTAYFTYYVHEFVDFAAVHYYGNTANLLPPLSSACRLVFVKTNTLISPSSSCAHSSYVDSKII